MKRTARNFYGQFFIFKEEHNDEAKHCHFFDWNIVFNINIIMQKKCRK